MIHENKGAFIDSISENRADDYKIAINEAVSRQLVSIAYHYAHLERIKTK